MVGRPRFDREPSRAAERALRVVSTRDRLARNTLLNLAGLATPLLVGVAVIPLLVRALGVERFGLLSLVWVVLANLAIFDFGLGRATTKFIAEAVEGGASSSVPEVVWTIAAAQLALGIVAAVAFGSAASLLTGIVHVPVALRAEAAAVLSLLAAAIPVMLVGTCFTAVLEATERFDLLNAVAVPSGAATTAVPLVVVSLGGNLIAVVAALLAVRIAATLALVLLSVRAFPMLARVCAPSLAAIVRLRSFAGWVAVAAFTAPLLRYLDRYVVATLLSVSAVAYYSAASDMIERLWIVSTAAVLTLFPAFTAFRASGASQRTHAVFVFTAKALLIVVAPVALCLVVWAPALLRVWLGPAFAEHGATAFQLLALAAPVAALTPIAGAALQAYGRPDVIAKLYLVALPLNTGLVFLLVGAIGVTGAALSMSLRALAEASLMLAVALGTMQLPLVTFLAAVWRTIVLIGALAPLLWLAATALSDVGLQLAVAFVLLVLFAVGIWRWALTSIERVQVRGLVFGGER